MYSNRLKVSSRSNSHFFGITINAITRKPSQSPRSSLMERGKVPRSSNLSKMKDLDLLLHGCVFLDNVAEGVVPCCVVILLTLLQEDQRRMNAANLVYIFRVHFTFDTAPVALNMKWTRKWAQNYVTCGIPQGSILGLLLVTLYIYDLPRK